MTARLRGFSLGLGALVLAGGLLLASAGAEAGIAAHAPPPLTTSKVPGHYDRFIVKYRDGSAERRDTNSRQHSLDLAASLTEIDARNARLRRGAQTANGLAIGLRHFRRMALGADVVAVSRKLDATDSERLLRHLRAQPDVEYAEIDRILQPLSTPNDPGYTNQWGLQDADAGIRANTAWDVATGAGITVAVIDTGITSHSDLNANVVPGYDFISDGTIANDGGGRDPDPSDPGDWTSGQCGTSNSVWHGTHVAGIVAAVANNGVGVAGVAFNAKVMPVRALGTCGGATSDIADAIVWSSGGDVPGVPTLSSGATAKVINMSLGGVGSCEASMQGAINSAVARGTTVVVAAGNDGTDASTTSPANCGNVITVAAVGSNSKLATYSNFGPTVDIAAPGTSIYSTLNSGTTIPGSETYGYLSGTSMATPHVSGAIALVQSRRLALGLPLYTPAEAEAQLKATAYAPATACTCGCGFGLVDARSLVDAASEQPLTNGIAAGGLSATTGQGLNFALAVPRGQTNLSFATSGGSGNPDLYVKFGSAPTTTDYDCRSNVFGTIDSCPLFANPASGTWHVLVQATSSFSGVSLNAGYTANASPLAGFNANSNNLTQNFTSTASDGDGSIVSLSWVLGDGSTSTATNPSHPYTTAGLYVVQQAVQDNGGATACSVQSVPANPASVALGNNAPVTSLVANTGGELRYTLNLPVGGSGLSFVTAPNTGATANGDADIFVKFGAPPTTTDFDCSSDGPTVNERCDFATAQAGTWYVLVKSFASFNTLTLTGSYNATGIPYADFSFTSSPMAANFLDASVDTNGSIITRNWDFGDGNTSSATNPSHSYAKPGAYNVALTVTDNDGNSNTKTRSAPANPTVGALANATPVAVPDSNIDAMLRYTFDVQAGATGLTFTTSGTGANNTNDADLFVRFGSDPDTSNFDCTSQTPTPNESCTIVNSQAGTYHVLVHAFTAITGITLTASDTPHGYPVANFTYSVSAFTANFTDASSDSDGNIVSRNWAFGDGSTSTATNPSHTYAAAGIYNVQLSVTDNDGNTSSVSQQVTVLGAPVLISIADATVTEGDSGTKSATFVVSLSQPSIAPVTFRIATTAGTATGASDFVPLSLNNQVIPAGQTSASFNVTINGDTTIEPDETFTVNLSNVTGATVADGTATGTILNDDVCVLSIGDVSIAEGDSGTKLATFTLQLSNPSSARVTYDIATSDGTAIAGSDYIAKTQTAQAFGIGVTSKTFTVSIKGDTTPEPDETFNVNVSNVSGATVSDGQAVGTILNDDAAPLPTLSIGNVSVTEGDSGTKLATFTVQLSQAATSAVTYDIATSNGTATAGSDYIASSLTAQTIAAGSTSKTFSVTINGDTTVEADETFNVNVANVSGATVSDGQAVGTILNDDAAPLPTLSIGDVSVTEGDSGTKLATFTVQLSQAATSAVTYDIATSNGTATAGSDYVASSLTAQTIAAGSTSKTFSVTINGDTTVEPDETFNVNVANVSGATVSDGQAVGTILNDDAAPLPTLSIGDVSVTEGDSGTKLATFTVQLSQAATSAVTYDIATSNGTATAGSDYVASSLTAQTIAAGSTSKTFSVTINGDTTVEPDETFNVNVANVSGATVSDGQAVGTILNDDAAPLPTLSIGDVSVTEGDSGTKLATFTVQLSQAATSAVTYDIATSNGTATAGSDYVASSLSSQTIAAGATSKTFSVTINGDTTVEPDETFNVNVSNVSGATVSDGQAVGTILNDDTASLPTLSIGDVSVTEGNSGTKLATFTVQLSQAATSAVTYNIATSNGTATAGSDYVASSLSSQTIAAGATSKTFSVTINGDTTVEPDETFNVTASNVVGATVSDGVAVGTIQNDDSADLPILSMTDASIAEGNKGTKQLTFTLQLSRAATSRVTYDIATSDATATAGSDYVAKSQAGQAFAIGVTSKTFTVTIDGDTTPEPDETFFVNVTNVVGATAPNGAAIGTILNDDASATPSLSIADVSVIEGDSGTKLATFTVQLSQTATSAVTYNIATSNGTATAGSDYVASSLTAQTIPAGATSKTFSVTINGDTTVEADETFNVNVSNVSGATVSDGQAVGTILNDDAASLPTLSIGDVSVTEGDSGTKLATFTVQLSQTATSAVTYDIATSNGTATAGSDYVASSSSGQTIAAGATSKTFSVTINGDTTVEPDETFNVNVSNVSGATVSDGQAVGTILNDDTASLPTLSIGDVSVTEGNSGTKLATFTVQLSQAATSAVTYDIATSNGTATAGSDYIASSLTAQTIPAGATSKTFSVTINGDTTVEPDETFNVTASNVVGATVSDGVAVGMILNDDTASLPTLSIGDVSVTEGNSGTKLATFTVQLSQAATSAVTYNIATSNGTATAGSDYVASSLTGQTIAAGATGKTFSVTINGDTTVEPDETFNVTASNVVGATVSDGVAVGTIQNDDSAPLPSLSIADVSIIEGNKRTKTMTFRVKLSPVPTSTVTYDIATSDGTATADSDYVASGLTGETIPAGTSSNTFSVTINGDTTPEPDETFFVNVTNVVGASVADGQAVGTITDDDSTAQASIDQVQGTGDRSPLDGEQVSVDGVVTAITGDGYFLQSQQRDTSTASSDGIFVAGGGKPDVGQLLRVTANVAEVAATPDALRTQTELVSAHATVLATHQALPEAVVLTRANGRDAYERYEGMRVMVPSLAVISPVEGTVDRQHGSAQANGVFYGVPSGMQRPFREAGLPVSQVAMQANAIATTVFDENPERLRIDSAGQTGAIPLAIDAGATIAGLTGVLGDTGNVYRLLPDTSHAISMQGGAKPRAIPIASNAITIGSASLGGLYDDRDDHHGEPVPTIQVYAQHLAKNANALCQWTGSPLVLGVTDVESRSVLEDLAASMQDTSSCPGHTGYRAFAVDGSAIDTDGFLVSAAEVRTGVPRVQVLSMIHVGNAEQFLRADGRYEPLFDQQPLAMKLQVNGADGSTMQLSVLLARMTAVEDQDKRAAQAKSLAALISDRNRSDPNERLVVLADINARAFDDGHGDVVGAIKGRLLNLTDTLPAAERYTSTHEGNAEALSHILVSPNLLTDYPALHLDIARINADFGIDDYGDATVPLRNADRDPQVLVLPQR